MDFERLASFNKCPGVFYIKLDHVKLNRTKITTENVKNANLKKKLSIPKRKNKMKHKYQIEFEFESHKKHIVLDNVKKQDGYVEYAQSDPLKKCLSDDVVFDVVEYYGPSRFKMSLVKKSGLLRKKDTKIATAQGCLYDGIPNAWKQTMRSFSETQKVQPDTNNDIIKSSKVLTCEEESELALSKATKPLVKKYDFEQGMGTITVQVYFAPYAVGSTFVMNEMHRAAAAGNLTIVSKLSYAGNNIMSTVCKQSLDELAMTPLDLAAKFGHDKVMKKLKSIASTRLLGLCVKKTSGRGQTLLHYAVIGRNLKCLQYVTDILNTTALSHFHRLEYLTHQGVFNNSSNSLQDEVDVFNARNVDGKTALSLACSSNDNIHLVRHLVESGVDVITKDNEGNTPLLLACQINDTELTLYLLGLRAPGPPDVSIIRCQPNVRNNKGEYPLQIAARNGNVQIVDALLKVGASIMLRNKDGETALHEAAQYGHKDVIEILITSIINCSCGVARLSIEEKNDDVSLNGDDESLLESSEETVEEKDVSIRLESNVKSMGRGIGVDGRGGDGRTTIPNCVFLFRGMIKLKTASQVATENGYDDIAKILLAQENEARKTQAKRANGIFDDDKTVPVVEKSDFAEYIEQIAWDSDYEYESDD